ncbi:MAG: LamG-like jellyroll fold domain-containing protein [Spirochaetota bacterium]
MIKFVLLGAIVWAAAAYPREGVKPIAWWSFEEGGGSSIRDSIGGMEGVLKGAEFVPGKKGGCLSFNGSTSAEVPSSEKFNLGDACTIELLVKLPGTNGQWQNLASKWGKTRGIGLYVHMRNGTTGFSATFSGAKEAFNQVNGKMSVVDGAWHHLVAAFDGRTKIVRMFVDGVPCGNQEMPSGEIVVNEAPLVFGTGVTGFIDEVKIYDRALTTEEVTAAAEDAGLSSAIKVKGSRRSGPPSDDYQLVWQDEFNGTALDMSKWMFRVEGPRLRGFATNTMVRLDGSGNAVLSVKRDGDKILIAHVASQNKFETVYGYFECSVRYENSHGAHWSAFWLQSPTTGKFIGDPGRSGVEVDIYECWDPEMGITTHNIHWDGYGKDHKFLGSQTRYIPDLMNGYHTVGLEWTPTEWTFFLDGVKSYTTATALSHTNEFIILATEVSDAQVKIIERISDFSYNVYFDYVRVYKRKTK